MTEKKNYALPIAMMYLLFFMIAFVTNLCNPMAVIVKNQFDVSNAMAQLGNAANFIAYAVMGIPAGILLKKIGYKKTALAAIAVGFAGVFLQYVSGWDGVQSYGVYLAGAFIAGFCMCMLNTVVNPMLNTLGGGGKRGNQLIQFGGVGNSLAATFVTIFVGALVGDASKAQISDATPCWCLSYFPLSRFPNRIRRSHLNPHRNRPHLLTARSTALSHSVTSTWASSPSSCIWESRSAYLLTYCNTCPLPPTQPLRDSEWTQE